MAKRLIETVNRQPADNPLAKAVREVEECMRKNNVSVSSGAAGGLVITIHDKEFYIKNDSGEKGQEFPRVFDDEKLIVWE